MNQPLPSLTDLELRLECPKAGAFGTISPIFEISGLIIDYFNSAFGEDTGPRGRWLNNKHIHKEDFGALRAF